MLITEYNMDKKDIVVVTFVIIIRCFCLIVTVQVSWNIFLAIVCFSYGKLNQLNMDEDAWRWSEGSSDDDYLCDWLKSFMICQAEIMIVWTRHLRLNQVVRKPELMMEHCTQIQKILKRKLVCKGQKDVQY
jgi:hypothetical protein